MGITKWCCELFCTNHRGSTKIAAVRTLTVHLTNHPSKMNYICWPLQENVKTNSWTMFSHGLLHMDIAVLAYQKNLRLPAMCRHLVPVSETSKERWLIGIDSRRESRKSMRLACFVGDVDNDEDSLWPMIINRKDNDQISLCSCRWGFKYIDCIPR